MNCTCNQLICYEYHGFNISDRGAETTDTASPYIEALGVKIVDRDYGYTFLAGAKYINKRLARLDAPMMRPGSAIHAHSNGGTIGSFVADQGVELSSLVLVQPALNRNWQPPDNVANTYVFYNSGDGPTQIARWVPLSRWGSAGRNGLDPHPTVTCIDTGKYGYLGHSIEYHEIEIWGPVIADAVIAAPHLAEIIKADGDLRDHYPQLRK